LRDARSAKIATIELGKVAAVNHITR
jgi:hypothetical protein